MIDVLVLPAGVAEGVEPDYTRTKYPPKPLDKRYYANMNPDIRMKTVKIDKFFNMLKNNSKLTVVTSEQFLKMLENV